MQQAESLGWPKQKISKFSEELSLALNWHHQSDVRETIVKQGGQIEFIDFWEENEKAGALLVESSGEFTIYVPSHTSIERDNFTIAHEYGHYILHYALKNIELAHGETFVAYRYGAGPVEWEANWFAASFLIPESLLKKHIHRHGKDVAKIADTFSVSKSFCEFRMRELNLDNTHEVSKSR